MIKSPDLQNHIASQGFLVFMQPYRLITLVFVLDVDIGDDAGIYHSEDGKQEHGVIDFLVVGAGDAEDNLAHAHHHVAGMNTNR